MNYYLIKCKKFLEILIFLSSIIKYIYKVLRDFNPLKNINKLLSY